MLWALSAEDVERLATGRAALDFASGQSLYALPARGQGVVQSASCGGLELRVHCDHLALASPPADGAAEVPRGPFGNWVCPGITAQQLRAPMAAEPARPRAPETWA